MSRGHVRREHRRMQAAAEVIVSHRVLLDAGHVGVVEDALAVLQRELLAASSLRELRWLAGSLPLRESLHTLRVASLDRPALTHAAGELALALEVACPRESLPRRRVSQSAEVVRRAAASPLCAPAIMAATSFGLAAAMVFAASLWACGYTALPEPFDGWLAHGFLASRAASHLLSAGVASLAVTWILCWWIGDALASRRYERRDDRSRPRLVESRGAVIASFARRVAGAGVLLGAAGLVVASGVGGGFAAAMWQLVCVVLWVAPVLVASLAGVAVIGLGARVVEWLAWHLSRKLDRGWSSATSAWPRWEGSAVTSLPWIARERVEWVIAQAVRVEAKRQEERSRESRSMEAMVQRLRSEMEVDEISERGSEAPLEDDLGADEGVSASEVVLGLLRDRSTGAAFRADFILAMAHRAAEKELDESALAVVRGTLLTLEQAGKPATRAERNTLARLASQLYGGFGRLQRIASTPVFTEVAAPTPVAVPAPPPVPAPVVEQRTYVAPSGVRVSYEPVPIWHEDEFRLRSTGYGQRRRVD